MFKKVDTNLNFVERENRVEESWKKNNILEKCLKKNIENKKNNSFVFYDGPPTANGKPHIGHVETRAFKDLIPRYHQMKGQYVPRKAGWDTHGLPVELEVEKKLGINGKEQIEAYGIEPFINQCKENVWKYKAMWEEFSYKVGFFADMDNPYVTYYDDYIESVWWALNQIWNKGLLYKSFKIVPYCPRCGTPLSSHEVAQGYKDIKTKTGIVRFKVKNEDAYFLAWTTTPWTLPSNLALCVNPNLTYLKIKAIDNNIYYIGKDLCDKVLSKLKTEENEKTYEVIKTFKGKDLEFMEYEPLYPYAIDEVKKQKKKAFVVVCDEYVTMDDGTGIVHIAPAFGEDDNRVCKKYDIAFIQLINEKGQFVKEATDFAMKTTTEADPLVLENLNKRGLLYDSPIIEHSYPHCWRCDTPLIYYARETWFIKMEEVREKLIKNNEKIGWYPDSIGKGRFGDWLSNVQDWGISRNRYWGTPLNIWECDECGHRVSIGSKKELKEKAIDLNGDVELHRPYIDEVHLKCDKCGKTMTRVKEVIDCWFDSGAMPYAQLHYPFENKDLFEEQFPANFICEAVDQTRGWFYSLLAESTLLFDNTSYKNCLVLGHVQDEKGKKMSKHLGNVVEPMEALNKHGADAIRWFFYSNSFPWLPKKFSDKAVREGQSKFLATLYNVYAFFVLYANIDDFNPKNYSLDINKVSLMDKWLLSKFNSIVKIIDEYLNEYKINEATQVITTFTDELSNWYIRRNRDRFWASGMKEDKINAYTTLYHILVEFSKLIAPFVPFISDDIYMNLQTSVYGVDEDHPESVHLTSYPKYNDNLIDEKLVEDMDMTIKIVELGRAARNEANIKNRQPLNKMLCKCDRNLDKYFIDIIAQELNIKNIEFKDDLTKYTTYIIKPQLKTVGPKYGKALNKIKDYLSNIKDTAKVYQDLKQGNNIDFDADGIKVSLSMDDVIIEASKNEGYITAIDGSNTVVLDTTLTDELIEEGYIREIISKIQTMRKDNNFEVMDKIYVYIYGDEYIENLTVKYKNMILKEIMAHDIIVSKSDENAINKQWEVNDKSIFIAIKK